MRMEEAKEEEWMERVNKYLGLVETGSFLFGVAVH